VPHFSRDVEARNIENQEDTRRFETSVRHSIAADWAQRL